MAQTAVFAGCYASLAEISAFISKAARQAGLDSQNIYAAQLAVDEACTNIINHAYGGEDRGEITCSVNPAPGQLTIILEDNGHPFKPGKIRGPNRRAPLSRRKQGGLGLFFIYSTMDEVRYETSAGHGNRLTLVKRQNPAH
ncbi:MAG TPA: ATP-binding protein [Anaerolineaceae bacterium]